MLPGSYQHSTLHIFLLVFFSFLLGRRKIGKKMCMNMHSSCWQTHIDCANTMNAIVSEYGISTQHSHRHELIRHIGMQISFWFYFFFFNFSKTAALSVFYILLAVFFHSVDVCLSISLLHHRLRQARGLGKLCYRWRVAHLGAHCTDKHSWFP